MDGGNDGINTVVPFKDEGYAKHRRALHLATDSLVKLSSEAGLHTRMPALGDIYNDSELAIVQGVGYPNPNRSHFQSMAIWHTAEGNTEKHMGNGWLGQTLISPRDQSDPSAVFIGQDELPVALRGRRCVSVTVPRLEDVASPADQRILERLTG
jgi:uncharacterized protein (DUF1501 family)